MFVDKKFFKLCLKSGIVGMAVSLTIWDKLFYFSGVDGVSMQPLINSGGKRNKKDRVFVIRSHLFKSIEETVQRGDVVSLISPKNFDECFIKRVIGLPGDVVKTISYKKNYIVVPQGHCWIEGDNHKASYDSNKFGCIPMGLILGKAIVLKSPVEYQDLFQYLYALISSFSWIETHLPINRIAIQLSPKQDFMRLNTPVYNRNCFIDYKRKEDQDENDLYEIEDVKDGVLSQEVINEINSDRDKEENISFFDSDDKRDD